MLRKTVVLARRAAAKAGARTRAAPHVGAQAAGVARRSSPSKNDITLEQLALACRHVREMMAVGVTENLAIRTLELFADVYAKLLTGGSATPHHVDQVPRWSLAALATRAADPGAKAQGRLIVEHGTPKRQFARLVLDLYDRDLLDEGNMRRLVEARWKLAVITVEEDRRLNSRFRSVLFDSPEARWSAAGIEFSDGVLELGAATSVEQRI